MSNPIVEGINAVIEHIKARTSVSEDTVEAERLMRKELKQVPKEELIEMIIGLKIKRNVKVVQADLVGDILCDPRCAVLTYEEISETILENMDTDQKFSPANISWYKSNLQNVKGLPVLNRMPAAERRQIDRQIVKESMNSK